MSQPRQPGVPAGATEQATQVWFDGQGDRRAAFQLDSELPQFGGRTFAFGSGGLLYVQVCGACRISTHLWQCT